jgi:hypothetical protein
VLGCAAVLRFYHFSAIPYTHDEYSALSRVGFNSFSDFIQQGVLPDFHPAGVQFFLWKYTQLLGTEPWVVKLPFALLGVAAVYLIYLLGKDWFSPATGLLAASFAAVSQYFILYSQVARPYGPALFFCLLALYGWKKLVFDERRSWRPVMDWVVGATLAAYSHYFALLFLVLVGASGLFFLRKSGVREYLLSAKAIVLLYIPHFSIFFAQLSKGGVEGWLAKPTWAFVPDYFSYLMHYSWVFVAALLIPLSLGVFYPEKNKRSALAWLGISWWVVCFLIGFYYSVYRSAILQYSGLLFAAPLGVLGVFSLFRFRAKYVSLATIALLLSGCYSLIYEREHYHTLYQSPYTSMLHEMQGQGVEQTNLLVMEPHIYRTIAAENELDTHQVQLINKLSIPQFAKMLDTLTTPVLNMGLMHFADPELLALARAYYPYVTRRKNYYQGSFWQLSKQVESNSVVVAECYFARKGNHPAQWLTPQNPYAKGIELTGLDTLIRDKHDRFVFAAQATGTGVLASALMVGDSVLNWQSSEIFVRTASADHWQYHSFTLPHIQAKTPGAVLKLFVWNTGQDSVWLGQQKLCLESGNPYVYGLYEAF